MAIEEPLSGLTGSWTGTNMLWLHPEAPVHESLMTAEVVLAAGGNFLTMTYDWSFEGPQDGLLVLGSETAPAKMTSVWLDSFHTAPGMMQFRTVISEQGIATLDGSYPAPEGPDWGWRIIIDPTPAPEFHLVMFNITPDGAELKAVETVFRRLVTVD